MFRQGYYFTKFLLTSKSDSGKKFRDFKRKSAIMGENIEENDNKCLKSQHEMIN